MKKLVHLTVLLIALLVLGLFAGCSSNEPGGENNAAAKEDFSIKIGVPALWLLS